MSNDTIPPVDRTQRCTTDGQPFDPTTKENGQQKNYVILCDEERAKGFVRPVRRTYIHRGKRLRGELEMLPAPVKSDHADRVYVAIDRFTIGEGEKQTKAGSYLTQEQVDQIRRSGGFYGGCGTPTIMGTALAETYARDPKFYGATFCCGCNRHLPVGEFVWEDGTVVGS